MAKPKKNQDKSLKYLMSYQAKSNTELESKIKDYDFRLEFLEKKKVKLKKLMRVKLSS